jgi:dienelactone hydrolase
VRARFVGTFAALARHPYVLTALALSFFATASSPFWKDLGAGKHAVGYRVIYTRDQRHAWSSGGGRPIRVSIWYPAEPANKAAMTYGDYLRHDGPPDLQAFNAQLDETDRESWLSDLREIVPDADKTYARLLALPAAAHRDAPPSPGRFPLVLYSGGKGARADDNVELAEFLASHGYVVATVPQLGPSETDLALGSSAKEIALHADDFEAALGVLRALPYVDFDRIAAAGHSAGGEAAAELAMRHSNIRAVVGLDASFGMTSGARVFRQLPEYAPRRAVGAALLDLRRANGSQGVTLDLTAVDALRWRHVSRIMIDGAYHGDFTQWGMVAYVLGIPMPAAMKDHTRALGHDVNVRAYKAVLEFLDAYLAPASHHVHAVGERDGLGLGVHVELLEHVVDVIARGERGDAEAVGDDARLLAGGQQ